MSRTLLMASVALAMLAHQAASAQEANAPADDRVVLGNIVVTAQRREERLQDVPVSVTAFDAELLQKSGVTDTRALTQVIPNMVFSRVNSSVQPYVRGIGTRNANVGDEANVATYIDGVYQPVMSSTAFDLVNVERVEVLRGPQGTLFGRNATGGLINVITTDPSYEPEASFTARVGSFNERSLGLYGSTGLSDALAVNLSMFTYEDDGYVDHVVKGGKIGDRNALIGRAKMLVEPNDDWRILLTLAYNKNSDGSGVAVQPYMGNTAANAAPPFGVVPTQPWESSINTPTTLDSEQLSFDLQTTTDFDQFSLQTTTSFQTNVSVSVTDTDATDKQIQSSRAVLDSEYVSTEWRLLSNGEGKFNWIAGVFLIDGVGTFDPIYSFNSAGAVAVTIESQQNMQSWAVFGEGSYDFNDRWSLTLGGRYSYEQRDFNGALKLGGVTQISSVGPLDDSFSKFTPRVTLQYNITDTSNVYATYSQGFKSGLYNGFSTSAASGLFADPEQLDAFELGLKSDPLSWLRANISLFHYEYKDQQLSIRRPNTTSTLLLNAAESSMNGAEVELLAQATDELSLRLSGSWLDATWDSFPEAVTFDPITTCPTGVAPCGNSSSIGVDVSGNHMLRAPEYTLGGGFNWEHDINNGPVGAIGASGNVFYSGEYFWDFDNRLRQPEYTTVNAQVYLTSIDDKWKFTVWGNNLTDEEVFQQLTSGSQADLASYERPASYGVSVSGKF